MEYFRLLYPKIFYCGLFTWKKLPDKRCWDFLVAKYKGCISVTPSDAVVAILLLRAWFVIQDQKIDKMKFHDTHFRVFSWRWSLRNDLMRIVVWPNSICWSILNKAEMIHFRHFLSERKIGSSDTYEIFWGGYWLHSSFMSDLVRCNPR